ncbi:uncharacterized small protein (DUF1192 family) [Litorimonas taeanensis]|uniref:Uncharacterized small protein (DUF1192 family) n=1 Tax=Litorimonas taeanensis TaxID=568099 RepID=A0A420WDV9_9PROT|nr:DUF1192 domain-containing protein [Litorimonas taeanensis]RKQ69201.1 uncharacterized small protein (DUF1192 family) [Litorimonas taeanensis]
MDEESHLSQSGTISVGEDLYGLSLHELEARIQTFKAEISRLEQELEKKRTERTAADSLFAPKN